MVDETANGKAQMEKFVSLTWKAWECFRCMLLRAETLLMFRVREMEEDFLVSDNQVADEFRIQWSYI